MANTTRKMAAMAMVMTLGMAATAAADDELETRETIVLSIENKCGLPRPVVEAAQDTAVTVYDAIGVRLVWLTGRAAPPPELAGALRLRIVLVGEIAEGRLLSQVSVPRVERATVLAVAPVAARSAYLFCRRIAELARVSRIKALETALGRALAHEIGHFVLPHMVHSDTGIMRARLDLHRVETSGFTEDQGASIRTLLMAQK
ncbi:MAG TPA: hypothetical protein VIX63_16445 [Vicinamibacterales bacterium]